MSNKQNDLYLENKEEEFAQILNEERWEDIDKFYKQLEDDGMEQYVVGFSKMMTDEEVREYKKWDNRVNGSTITQIDDEI